MKLIDKMGIPGTKRKKEKKKKKKKLVCSNEQDKKSWDYHPNKFVGYG